MSVGGHPPRLARRLVRWALPLDRRDDITGDLEEVFRRRSRERGRLRARLWYWREALVFSGRFLAERFREALRRRVSSDEQAPARIPKRISLPFGFSLLDLKLGVRMLFKYPGLTLVGTLAMSVAIATVAGFHAFTEILVNPSLPVPDGDRVVAVWNVDTRTAGRGQQTVGDMLTWREQLESIEDVGAFTTHELVVFGADGEALSVRAAEISPSAFRMLRVPPLLGRPLVDTDERPGSPAVALLGFDLWQSGFGADTAIVGKTIRLRGVQHSVVGVMPRGFGFPVNEQLWTPTLVPRFDLGPGAGQRVVFSIGRLAPGITLQEAEAELQGVGSRLARDHPETHAHLRPGITTYARSFMDVDDPNIAIKFGLAQVLIVIVLVIAAVNVGTLVYARSAAREGEIAVRNALGASRHRIAMQLFAEALVLASLAATIGVGLVIWALNEVGMLLSPNLIEDIPYWLEVRMGPSTVFLLVGLTLLAAVLTGVLPALKVTGRRMKSGLQRAGAGGSGLRFGKAASAVVITQVAISVALLTVAGTRLRGFIGGQAWDDGIAREEYLVAELRWDLEPSPSDLLDERERDVAPGAELWQELGRRVSREPQVLGVTFGTRLPGTSHPMRLIEAEGISNPSEPGAGHRVRVASVAPNYFDVFGAPVLAGRAFDAGDMIDSEGRVAIVNDAFVRAVLASASPVGRRIRLVAPGDNGAPGEWLEIVGVARDLAMDPDTPVGVQPAVYFPLVTAAGPIHLAAHIREDPSQFVGRLRAIGVGLDPAVVVHEPRTLEEVVDAGITLVRLLGLAIGLLTFAALLLSTTGVYALMSFTVTQRTREIGIRVALGADPRRVVGEVFSRAIGQLAAGTFLGLGLGYVGAGGTLFTEGPGTILGIAALILIMGLIACGKPVRRALQIQPTEALREGG